MAEQPTQPEVGSAMWGGRPWREGRVRAAAQPTDRESSIPEGAIVALVSIALLVVGGITMAVGAGLQWGLGAGLFTGGAVAVGVGVLLGVTS